MSNRVPEIDGLRAIAMTMVIAQHSGLLPFGWIGVWLFYVISGFVITRGFSSEDSYQISIPSRYINFMGRRFFRIVPVYLLYLFAVFCVLFVQHQPQSFSDLPSLLTFTFNWKMIFGYMIGSGPTGSLGHLWTLSVEEQFYLFFPLIALYLRLNFEYRSLSFYYYGPVIRFFYSENVAVIHDNSGWSAFSIYAASICHFDAFLSGSLIARLEPYIRRKPKIAYIVWAVAISSSAIYVISYFLINRSLGANGINALKGIISGTLYGEHREIFVYIVVDLFVSALLVQVITQRNLTTFLSSSLLVKIGAISYGGYLFHALLLAQVKIHMQSPVDNTPLPGRLAIFSMIWILTVSLAYISFRWFETPISRWARARLLSKI